MILGLEVDGVNKAFPLTTLRFVRVVNDQLGSKPVVIVHQPDSDTTTAFVTRLIQTPAAVHLVNRRARCAAARIRSASTRRIALGHRQ